jgi:hypothetical protein
VALDVVFKNCCLKTGSYDGKGRDYFFQSVELPAIDSAAFSAAQALSSRSGANDLPRKRNLGDYAEMRWRVRYPEFQMARRVCVFCGSSSGARESYSRSPLWRDTLSRAWN